MVNGVMVDRSTGIVTLTPVTQIAKAATVCTAAQFNNARGNWESLVPCNNWTNVKMTLDTPHFVDMLETEMARVQHGKLVACAWDNTKMMSKDNIPNHTIRRAIPINGGKSYVVGVFKWR